MKGDEVEGWGRQAERGDGTRSRWRRGVRVRVLERRTGGAEGERGGGLTAGEILSR